MISILEAPEIRRRTLPITLATWHWMIENGMVSRRAELIRGVIVEKLSKTPLHGIISGRFFHAIAEALGDSFWVRKEEPLTLKDTEAEPDVSVVCGRDLDFLGGHPQTAVLTVEVCVSSEAAEREMIKVYAEAGIPEAWLVVAGKRRIEVYTGPVGGEYTQCRHVAAGEPLVATSVSGLSLSSGELFPPG